MIQHIRYLITGAVALFLALLTSAPTVASRPHIALSPARAQDNQSPALEGIAELNAAVAKLYQTKKFKEALPLAKRLVEITEKEYGPEHRTLTPALASLAELYFALERYREAEPHFRRALAITEKAFGPEHRNLLRYLGRLALLQYRLKHFAESESSYRRVLVISEKEFGPKSMELVQPLEWLALFYSERKDEQLGYSRLVELVESLPEDDFRKLDERLSHYGCLREGLKNVDNLYEGVPDESIAGKAVTLEKPRYPSEAKAAQVRGVVAVRVLIDEQGKVFQACAINGPKLVADASVEAARRSRFTPTTVNGKPVKAKGLMSFGFEIR